VSESLVSGLPATFTAAQAQHGGLTRRRLTSLQHDGAIERIGRGVYRRSGAPMVDEDLLEIAIKTHRPTLCLVSALARHELTDQIPSHHDVAVPRGEWRPTVSVTVRWHRFDRATFEVGRTEIAVDAQYKIGLYDAPRSIIDVFRLRHTIGPDVANEALRRWLRAGGHPTELLRYAKSFPIARPAILNALQILL
jgi:predicted transcriptional regulator of viral defense system